MRVIFFGTPDFSVPALERIIEKHEVVAVVTQLDKPKGRSSKLVPTPVKACAIKHNIPVLQYRRIRKEGVEDLRKLDADIMVTCAYGQILSQEILDMTKYGVINIHGSILPYYRGAAPIQWAIIDGVKTTGITILKSAIGIDDGDTILFKETDIKTNETSDELFNRLSILGSEAIVEALDLIESGKATYTPQNHEIATVCKMLKPEMAHINFKSNAQDIVNLIHGISTWPTAHITIDGATFKVFRASVIEEDKIAYLLTKPFSEYACGEVVVASNKKGLVIKALDGYVSIDEILPECSKRMQAKAYLNGKSINVGSIVVE